MLVDEREQKDRNVHPGKIVDGPIPTTFPATLTSEPDFPGTARAGDHSACFRIGRNERDDLLNLGIRQARALGVFPEGRRFQDCLHDCLYGNAV